VNVAVSIQQIEGTQHTIKYTDKTVPEGAEDTGKGVEKGSTETYFGAKKGTKVTIKYIKKAGGKTGRCGEGRG
jgi:hypothetical protein